MPNWLVTLLEKKIVKWHYQKKTDLYLLTTKYPRPGKNLKRIRTEIRWQVWRRDNFTCVYCQTTHGILTVDHVVPRSIGGTNDLRNLAACCIPCNGRKSSMSAEEFLSTPWLKRRKRKVQHLLITIAQKETMKAEKTGLQLHSKPTGMNS